MKSEWHGLLFRSADASMSTSIPAMLLIPKGNGSFPALGFLLGCDWIPSPHGFKLSDGLGARLSQKSTRRDYNRDWSYRLVPRRRSSTDQRRAGIQAGGSGPDGRGYRAVISFYPNCWVFQEGRLGAPLLLLFGGADNWEPPGQCIERGEALQAPGAPITMKIL